MEFLYWLVRLIRVKNKFFNFPHNNISLFLLEGFDVSHLMIYFFVLDLAASFTKS